jgi:hypothetical protein
MQNVYFCFVSLNKSKYYYLMNKYFWLFIEKTFFINQLSASPSVSQPGFCGTQGFCGGRQKFLPNLKKSMFQHSIILYQCFHYYCVSLLVIGNFRFRYRFRPKFRFRYAFRYFGFGSNSGFGRSLVITTMSLPNLWRKPLTVHALKQDTAQNF